MYVASVPALPGCVAQGEKVEDALRDLTAAMGDVLEVIRQEDPDRYKQLTSVSLSERRLGVISRAEAPDPVFEQDSLSEPGLTWRAA